MIDQPASELSADVCHHTRHFSDNPYRTPNVTDDPAAARTSIYFVIAWVLTGGTAAVLLMCASLSWLHQPPSLNPHLLRASTVVAPGWGSGTFFSWLALRRRERTSSILVMLNIILFLIAFHFFAT